MSQGGWWSSKWNVSEKTSPKGTREKSVELHVLKMWVLVKRTIKCGSYEETLGLHQSKLAFYRLEICGDRQACWAPLIAHGLPWTSHVMAQGSYKGKARAQKPGKKSVRGSSQTYKGIPASSQTQECDQVALFLAYANMPREGAG